jgi:type I restriction enzyme R subunit
LPSCRGCQSPPWDSRLTGENRLCGGSCVSACLPNNAARDAFAADYSYLGRLWEAISPENVHVDAIRDDLDTLVLDADLLEAVLGAPDPRGKAKEIEIKVARRLRKRMHDPRFKALSERLEALKERHEQGLLLSIDFLKALLELARDVVAAECSSTSSIRIRSSLGGRMGT